MLPSYLKIEKGRNQSRIKPLLGNLLSYLILPKLPIGKMNESQVRKNLPEFFAHFNTKNQHF